MSNSYSGPGIENQQYKKDIAVVERMEKSYTIIDINRSPSLFDHWVRLKEQEKIEKYQDLKREVKRPWNCKEVVLVTNIIGGPLLEQSAKDSICI